MDAMSESSGMAGRIGYFSVETLIKNRPDICCHKSPFLQPDTSDSQCNICMMRDHFR